MEVGLDRGRLAASPATIAAALASVAAGLVLASLAGQYARFALAADPDRGLVRLFDMGTEGNVPTWYQSTLLLGCAVLLAVICAARRARADRFARHWLALSILFALLSLDEAAAIHEMLGRRPPALDPGSLEVLWYAWLVPAVPAIAALGWAYLRFVVALPRRTRALLLLAGSVYLAGSVGLEAASHVYGTYARTDVLGQVLSTLEEALESAGTILFAYTLLAYMRDEGIGVGVLEARG